MVITLSAEQQDQLFAWIRPVNEAHVNEGCEIPGYTLEIRVAGPWGSDAMAVCGSQRLDLGDVTVTVS